MLKIKYHSSFKRDYKRLKKRGMNMDLLHEAISLLAKNTPLPEHYRDHALTGNLKGYRDLHITPDWLLIYKIKRKELILILSRTGSHSDLF
ncbi:MAG TPA: type II toxin-antitoxin system YafQ family toxin [Clostridia bacterium]|jgi:mRNA interferase YafQ|nr:MAG: mRNA interferase YafQ [Firmicutes bacterium ADurb.Bin099]HHT95130.1 type II toxin-antitoxin system YafQ family toxin [Clostridiaceae bacterium]HOF27416.1 type II toxin-antitoxin system YafQ family toxin [Clostridia bacterium]HOM34445.1 type II toxin-antitoxin system YafQ family toxin [Clostridia bacterium]HOR90591.1 type II toxin-antitoxin system YafQ family toxin [Clostridia bacterium]